MVISKDPRENDTPRLSTSLRGQAVENLHDDNRATDVCDPQAGAVVNADDAIQVTQSVGDSDLEGQGVLGLAWLVDMAEEVRVVRDEVDIGVVHIGVGHTLDGLNSDNLAGHSHEEVVVVLVDHCQWQVVVRRDDATRRGRVSCVIRRLHAQRRRQSDVVGTTTTLQVLLLRQG